MEGKLAYGGWANGMPRKRAVRPMQIPVKVALSKMCFWRVATDVAEPNAHIGCNLLLYHEGFKRRREGEERLVGEQDNERAN